MARKPRLHFPGAVYHVTLRGNGRQDIFFAENDRTHFCLLMQEGVERFLCRIHAFCLMTNHVHLAIQVGDIPLSRIMQNLSFRYTRWINSRKGRTGHLFQGRYKAVLVDHDAYLFELVRYIHLNPTRVGIGKGPEDYRWSSHQAYCGLQSIPWLTTDSVLGQFAENGKAAVKRYRRFVADGLKEGHRPEFHSGGDVDGRLLGDDRFVEKVLGKPSCSAKKADVQEVIDVVLAHYGLIEHELRSPGKERRASEARAVAALIVFEGGIGALTELGRRVGREASTLSSAVRRLTTRLASEQALTARVERIRAQIAKLQA